VHSQRHHGLRGKRGQPLAALAFDIGWAGGTQLAVEQGVQPGGDVVRKPRRRVIRRVVESEQQPPRLGADGGDGVAGLDRRFGQPGTETVPPVRGIAGQHPRGAAGQVNLIELRPGDPARLWRGSEDMRSYALNREALQNGLVTREESHAYEEVLRLLAGHPSLSLARQGDG
jgi:hypothetical protein